MATLDEIRVAIEQRLEVVRAAKDEYERLVAALEALGESSPKPPKPRRRRPVVVTDEEAPYGYKKDGTPRKRPGRKAPEPIPAAAEADVRRAKAEGGAVLRITTGGVPAVIEGAEPAYVTQEG